MEGQYIIQQTGREEEEDEAPREGELREQDRFLPIYNISKVMKKVVPHSGKVAKEARECVQECVSEFISFITRLVMQYEYSVCIQLILTNDQLSVCCQIGWREWNGSFFVDFLLFAVANHQGFFRGIYSVSKFAFLSFHNMRSCPFFGNFRHETYLLSLFLVLSG